MYCTVGELHQSICWCSREGVKLAPSWMLQEQASPGTVVCLGALQAKPLRYQEMGGGLLEIGGIQTLNMQASDWLNY